MSETSKFREYAQLVLQNANEGSACELLAIRWLEEHPEDEDELITEEWIQATFDPEQHKRFSNYENYEYWLPAKLSARRELEFENGFQIWFYGFPLKSIKTRGQLRQLIKLLKGE